MVAATMVAILMDSHHIITILTNSLGIPIMDLHINQATSNHHRSPALHTINHDQGINMVDRPIIPPASLSQGLHSVVVSPQEVAERTLPTCLGLPVMV